MVADVESQPPVVVGGGVLALALLVLEAVVVLVRETVDPVVPVVATLKSEYSSSE